MTCSIIERPCPPYSYGQASVTQHLSASRLAMLRVKACGSCSVCPIDRSDPQSSGSSSSRKARISCRKSSSRVEKVMFTVWLSLRAYCPRVRTLDLGANHSTAEQRNAFIGYTLKSSIGPEPRRSYWQPQLARSGIATSFCTGYPAWGRLRLWACSFSYWAG